VADRFAASPWFAAVYQHRMDPKLGLRLFIEGDEKDGGLQSTAWPTALPTVVEIIQHKHGSPPYLLDYFQAQKAIVRDHNVPLPTVVPAAEAADAGTRFGDPYTTDHALGVVLGLI
jgi:hypothetical protein